MKRIKIVSTRLEAANPLTARGKKWLKKEIRKYRSVKNAKKLRYKLEHQAINSPAVSYEQEKGYYCEDQ